MKKRILILVSVFILSAASLQVVQAQCSICTKTASQLGEKPARGMNTGILYLMFTPLIIAGYIGFRWWQREKRFMEDEKNLSV